MASPETRKNYRVEQEGENEGTEGRGRTKKGKNGAKKLPQRGLGVAQLEKLRLQEQKMQETACFAATHGLHAPSFFTTLALAEKGNLYAQSYPYLQGKVEICNGLRDTNVLSFSELSPNPQNACMMPVSAAGLMITHVQGASDSVLHSNLKDKALAYSDLTSASNLNQPSRSSLTFMLPGHKEGYEPTPSNFAPAVDTSSPDSCLSSSMSAREQCSGKSTSVQKENGNVVATEVDAAKVFAFSTVDALSASSKSAISKGCQDTGLSSQGHLFHCQSTARTDRNVLRGQGVHDPFSSLFPASESSNGLGYNDFLKGSGLCIPETNGRGSLSNLQLLNSSFEPPDKNRSAVYQLHLPVMGVSSFGDMPKELSSFQNFLSDQGRTPAEKSSERKRPWLATQSPASLELNLMDSSSSGLGGLNRHSSNQLPKVQTSDREATCPTSGVLRCDLGHSAIPYLNINSSASISAPICKESQMSSFPSRFCPDPVLFLDVKRNAGSINGYSAFKFNPETARQTTPSSTLLSLGPTNKSGYDLFVQNLGGGESSSLQRDCREFQVMMSQKDAVEEWELNISFRKEQIDMSAAHLSDTKGKSSGIKTNGRSEALWSGEQSLLGAASQRQSLDLSLKLAL